MRKHHIALCCSFYCSHSDPVGGGRYSGGGVCRAVADSGVICGITRKLVTNHHSPW